MSDHNDYIEEIRNNYEAFTQTWKPQQESTFNALLTQYDKDFFDSYKRIVSLQAWRACLLENVISKESIAFFLEAQNDALVSHILARQGVWRSALKSLRSLIENLIWCVYYMDHPIEHRLWASGKHNPTFSLVFNYLEDHPNVSDVEKKISSVQLLKKEWGILSRAVHGSAKSFRMTSAGQMPSLFSISPDRMGGWLTRESRCVLGVNLLLMSLFRQNLAGAQMSDLRKAISLAVPKQKHKHIKDTLQIRL